MSERAKVIQFHTIERNILEQIIIKIFIVQK